MSDFHRRWCDLHDPCDLEPAHHLLKIAGIMTKEDHLGGNVYGLRVQHGLAYGLVTRNEGDGYEVGWYAGMNDDGESQEGQTLSQVINFLRSHLDGVADGALF